MSVTYNQKFDTYLKRVTAGISEAAIDVKNDLVNSARSTAPHKSGDLEKGITGEVTQSSSSFNITVNAAARGSNGYDYAAKRHDGSYFLGQQSQAKGSGMSQMSGNRFPVGQRYLQMPTENNWSTYKAHFEKAVESAKV